MLDFESESNKEKADLKSENGKLSEKINTLKRRIQELENEKSQLTERFVNFFIIYQIKSKFIYNQVLKIKVNNQSIILIVRYIDKQSAIFTQKVYIFIR
jgi:predicted nuclease with TOPRIM domain